MDNRPEDSYVRGYPKIPKPGSRDFFGITNKRINETVYTDARFTQMRRCARFCTKLRDKRCKSPDTPLMS